MAKETGEGIVVAVRQYEEGEGDSVMKRLDAFKSRQQLGKTALSLRAEADRIEDSLRGLSEVFETPEDMRILVMSRTSLLDMQTSDGGELWRWVERPGEEYERLRREPDVVHGPDIHVFEGVAIEYDGDERTSWVYNEDKTARVRFDENTTVGISYLGLDS